MCDPNTSSKCYWSLLKTLLNRKKIPFIPPLFHGDKYTVDFQEKSEIFNSFFADQCCPISNGSFLPSELQLRTDSTLSSCHFAKEDILRIINNLDLNKAQGHDEISIRMLKICGDSICRPLNIIFKTCLRRGKFPMQWKKLILFQFINKVISKLLKTTFSLLPICGSIPGSLLFLINVSDLSNGLKSKCKLFPDNTSLFSVAHDVNTTASDINNDLKLISDWAF